MRHKPTLKSPLRLQTAFVFATTPETEWVSDCKDLTVCPAQEWSIAIGSSAPRVSSET